MFLIEKIAVACAAGNLIASTFRNEAVTLMLRKLLPVLLKLLKNFKI